MTFLRIIAIICISSLFVPVVRAVSDRELEKLEELRTSESLESLFEDSRDPAEQRLSVINDECFPLRQKLEKINAEKLIKRYTNKKGYSDNRYIALIVNNDSDGLYKLGMEEYSRRPQSKKHLQNAYMLFRSAALRQQPDSEKMVQKMELKLSDIDLTQAKNRSSNLFFNRRNKLLTIGLPKKCDGSIRDIERRTSLRLFLQDVLAYIKEHSELLEKIPLNDPTELCGGYQEPCDGRIDLREELFLIPRDSLLRYQSAKIGAATRYFISRTADGWVIISAPDAEIEPITMSGSLQF